MDRAGLKAFVTSLGCGAAAGGYVFLRDPHWSVADRSAAEALQARAAQMPEPGRGWLCVRTGGSSGGVRFARHDEHTLSAAVAGFSQHFALPQVNAVGILPPWHISGFMARFRCVATGGRYVDAEWKAIEAGAWPDVPEDGTWVLSLVPTQLQRLLRSPAAVQWLRRFRVVFLGGGPSWAALNDATAAEGIPISLSYGMSETAAMVTAQRPHEFLMGDRSSGSPLPHCTVRINDEGRVVIGAASLFRGYFPDCWTASEFLTQDLGRLDEAGRLHLLGRADAAIITGGKKVQPAEIEAALRASGEFEDVAVIGVPDAEWGEIVVACYPGSERQPDFARAGAALAPYERPKRFIALAHWPRTAQGKINRAALREHLTSDDV